MIQLYKIKKIWKKACPSSGLRSFSIPSFKWKLNKKPEKNCKSMNVPTSCSGRFSAISFSSTFSPRSRFSFLMRWMRSRFTLPALISTLFRARRPKS